VDADTDAIVESLHKWTLCTLELKDCFFGWKTSIEKLIQAFFILSSPCSSLLGYFIQVSSSSSGMDIQLTKSQFKEYEESIRLMKQLEVYQRIEQHYASYRTPNGLLQFKNTIVNHTSLGFSSVHTTTAVAKDEQQEPKKKIDINGTTTTSSTSTTTTTTTTSIASQALKKKKFLGLSINTNVGRLLGGGGQNDATTPKSNSSSSTPHAITTPLSSPSIAIAIATTPTISHHTPEGSCEKKQSSKAVQKRLERIQREKKKHEFLKFKL
jgi:hypothetical protein